MNKCSADRFKRANCFYDKHLYWPASLAVAFINPARNTGCAPFNAAGYIQTSVHISTIFYHQVTGCAKFK